MADKKTLTAILILFPLGFISAQSSFDKFAISPKLGFYNWSENDGGFIMGLEVNTTNKDVVYSFDHYYYKEWNIIFGDSPEEHYKQVGVMIGKYYGEKLFRFQLQGGIAPIWGLRRTDLITKGGLFSGDTYDYENFVSLGLVFKLGFKINPSDFFGLGIDFQTNINPKNPVYMPMLSIEVGKIRTKTNTPITE